MVLAALAGIAPAARAGGFEFSTPGGVNAQARGGAWEADGDDASTVFLNPAHLAELRGTRLSYTQYLSFMSAEFDRAPQTGADGTRATFAPVKQQDSVFPLALNLALSSDFGLKDFGFGIGVTAPIAVGKDRYPDDVAADGSSASANRYAFISMDTALLQLAVAGAWKYHDTFGIGAAFQYMTVPWMKYAVIFQSTPGASPAANETDLRTDVNASTFKGFTGTLGAWYRPAPCLTLAASARIAPIPFTASGSVNMSGTPNSVFVTSKFPTLPASLSFSYPVTLQAGVKYSHRRADRELFNIEADFDWENWSALQNFHLDIAGPVVVSGTTLARMIANLDRGFQDTWSVRLGGQWNAIPKWLTVRGGWWYESAAEPTAYTMLDFPSWTRFGLSAGLSTEWRGLEFCVAYSHVFDLSRDVAAGQGRVYGLEMGPPAINTVTYLGHTPYAVNEGHYSASIDMVSLGVNIHWDTLIHGK
jgi:long-subunit fatty acid transport protein